MATLLFRKQGEQFCDANGKPLNGGKLWFYRAGTTELQNTYLDAVGGSPNANPLPLGSDGRLQTPVYFGDTSTHSNYKELLTTGGDVVVPPWPADNLVAATPAASSVVFTPPLFPWTQVAEANIALTTADLGDAFEADTSAGSVTFSLPSAASAGNGKPLWFKKAAAANSMILDPFGSETIDDISSSLVITKKDVTIGIVSNGAEWYVIAGFGYFHNFEPNYGVQGLVIVNNGATPTTRIDVFCSSAFIGTSIGALAVTINAAVNGINGLDTGSLANSTWYNVFLVSNGISSGALLSLSATAPTMPAGYVYKYRVGAVRTGGSATFLRTTQRGSVVQYQVVAASTTPNLPQMITGASGSPATPTWTAVAISSFAPPTAASIMLALVRVAASGTTMVAPNSSYGAFNSASNPPPLMLSGVAASIMGNLTVEGTDIFYADVTGNGALYAAGWRDVVNAS